MSKKNTKKTKITTRPDGLPAIDMYKDLPLDNKCQHDHLVYDKHGQVFRFKTASHNHIVEAGILCEFSGFDQFADKSETQFVLERHLALFKANPDPRQDSLITRLAVWKGDCAGAKDRTEKPVAVDHQTGEPKTGKLASRQYVLVTADEADVKTYQEVVCLRIVASEVDAETKMVKEETLKEAIIRRAQELKTRQDPWRIFQYYRPRLIEKKKLRLI